ncbi:alkaline protease secretion protein AprE [Ehrlichia ruminantium]|uniref:HlyD family type I secretion periplasmic adaptor subunit n=1 Tax=Ehrlichia ruminantium TaxID=779 RepID=UPI0007A0D7DD|nr:HlyD family type I secretion periplasmic adaptor subunit [Ehrlichia ruminantium]KYW93855.1 hemolysin D [Ehrlichia ruminantium]QLK52083.1 HlyD family type I secretion periplasmic adaptor subunit [Ehrlichia ruminantium]QLK53915.1 HlyD family type I secretion periplasmic adaptor subunit [Ehrlichia ruminantium]GAT75970.1 alkaline protease secretion protein AprE [Ehrlichia ruminantium]
MLKLLDNTYMYKKLKELVKTGFSLPKLLGHNTLHITNNEAPRKLHVLQKTLLIIDDIINFLFKYNKKDTSNEVLKISWGPLFTGFIVILLFFGVFGIWAAVAPLDGSVVAQGEVISSSEKQIVQHLEGGIIEKILVKEGEFVEKNQPIIYLHNTTAQANLDIIKERMLDMLATEARLTAIKYNYNHIKFPNSINNLSNKEIRDQIIKNQQQLFESHQKNISGQINILQQRTKQLHQELSGLSAQLTSATTQHQLINEELAAKKSLLADGYISKPYIIALERQYAESQGKIGQIESAIASVNQKIGENKLEIINITNNVQNKISIELKDTISAIADLKERMKTAQDVLDRTVIRSPQSGIITGLKYHTEGGVIPPGAPITNVVPSNDNLIVDAKIQTRNIEEILSAQTKEVNMVSYENYKGLKAKVRLSAYNIRKVGLANGIVTQVSADALTEANGMRYYKIQVIIPKEQSKKLKNLRLYPGMPAEVFIITQSRTLLNYLFTPITSTFEKAFNER